MFGIVSSEYIFLTKVKNVGYVCSASYLLTSYHVSCFDWVLERVTTLFRQATVCDCHKGDHLKGHRQNITSLSLTYHLLTSYLLISWIFIAIRHHRRPGNRDGISATETAIGRRG